MVENPRADDDVELAVAFGTEFADIVLDERHVAESERVSRIIAFGDGNGPAFGTSASAPWAPNSIA